MPVREVSLLVVIVNSVITLFWADQYYHPAYGANVLFIVETAISAFLGSWGVWFSLVHRRPPCCCCLLGYVPREGWTVTGNFPDEGPAE